MLFLWVPPAFADGRFAFLSFACRVDLWSLWLMWWEMEAVSEWRLGPAFMLAAEPDQTGGKGHVSCGQTR